MSANRVSPRRVKERREYRYIPAPRVGGKLIWEGMVSYDSRHEAVGEMALLDRRNPDFGFAMVVKYTLV